MTTTFDGWEARLTGDAMALPDGQLSDNTLMHFRTKGSRNGVRRYQLEDGTWTPLGLRERKAREGWGDGKAARAAAKAEKRAAKAEKVSAKFARKTAKKEARKARVAAKKEKKRLGNISKLTDEELKNKISRVKMEQEYKELTKSPIIKTAEKIVESVMRNKEAKLNREAKRAEIEAKLAEIEAKRGETTQKTIAAKAALAQARGNILDTVLGGAKRKEAKKKLLDTKADKTIRGAVRGLVSKVINKEGDRIVNEMGSQSLVMRGGRLAKRTAKKTGTAIKNRAADIVSGVKQGYKEGMAEVSEKRANQIGNLDEYDRKTRRRLGL